ncbi:sialate O-acetylesterase [Mangrovibacterium sp.]|uniref:alpha/beta hydrolase family protein n=1 Tax=Mangrovibacterium sp. TaxID=1961364 RepID=UPI003562A9E5
MNQYKILLTFFIFSFVQLASFSQSIKFSAAPEDYQLYARNQVDSAEVVIAGEFKGEQNVDGFSLKVFKDGVLYNQQNVGVKNKRFYCSETIHAGLHQFKFELYSSVDGRENLCFAADSVVCGDAYIISGQSNSHASSSKSTYSSPYCRSFGVKTGYEPYDEDDKLVRWGRATGNCPDLKGVGGWFRKNKFGVGVWGMQLMKLIVEEYQIPVCIINGGSGSSSIEQNMLYPEQPSLETSFGRLAYRVAQSGLKDHIKAILWHQGEANTKTADAWRSYPQNFQQLLADWDRVYTGVEKIYLFQLHPGCGGDYQSELRETQHQLALQSDRIEIMSTTGVDGHDGCHFSYEGYCEFAQRIFPLLARDFYGEKTDRTITPPALLEARFTGANEITLEFDQPIRLDEPNEVNGLVHELKDQFFFYNGTSDTLLSDVVAQLEVDGQYLTLHLKDQATYQSVTYLPGRCYLNTNDVYNGPWIRGAENNLGALSFTQKPIVQPSTSSDKIRPDWHGYKMLDSTLNGIPFKVVFPHKANQQRNWIWRARFWGTEPQTDLALLEAGFHVAYIDVAGLFGCEKAVKIWDEFYDMMVANYQLNPKVVLEGMSRGGLIVFNWANRNAEKVACIYADAPVCDFKSWPGGKGSGDGNSQAWQSCLTQYGFTEQVALLYHGNPIDHMEHVAGLKVPILCVIGDADTVVPFSENTALLENRLNALGWELNIIHKPGVGHHPHSLKDPKPIVDFILKNTEGI